MDEHQSQNQASTSSGSNETYTDQYKMERKRNKKERKQAAKESKIAEKANEIKKMVQ